MWRKMGYSSAMPFAPRMSRPMRAHSRAIQTLLRRDGLVVELFAELRVLQRAIIASHSRANRSPRDAVARLVQAAQRRLQTARFGQQIFCRNTDILQRKT